MFWLDSKLEALYNHSLTKGWANCIEWLVKSLTRKKLTIKTEKHSQDVNSNIMKNITDLKVIFSLTISSGHKDWFWSYIGLLN